MSRSECRSCRGTRHIQGPAGWTACSCLRSDRATRRYKEAGIGKRIQESTWRTFLHESGIPVGFEGLLRAAMTLKSGKGVSDWFLLHGGSPAARRTLSGLVLMAACDGGHVARKADLSGLVDLEFGRGEIKNDAPTADVLALELGSEPSHKWNKRILERILSERWEDGLTTLLLTGRQPDTLGSKYDSIAISEAIETRFNFVQLK